MKHRACATVLALTALMCTLFSAADLRADTGSGAPAASSDVMAVASPGNVEQFFRDRYRIPDSVSINAEPVRRSTVPHFYRTAVTVNDAKQPRTFNAFITDDARCVALGAAFALSGASEADFIRCVRAAASLPANARITIGSLSRTRLDGFFRARVRVDWGGRTDTGDLFVTPDRRAGVLGLLLPYRRDFVEQLIDTTNQPGVGAANAPVTIVEYADLECPGCAILQKFLESEFLPKYKSRVRIIFKEFPLTFHPWSGTAALANECAYQMDPSAYFGYRSLIFGSQDAITAANVRGRLLDLGADAGLNRAKLAGCLDAEASRGRVEASRAEGDTLGISGTPTVVINGWVVWAPNPADFLRMVDEALAAAGR